MDVSVTSSEMDNLIWSAICSISLAEPSSSIIVLGTKRINADMEPF